MLIVITCHEMINNYFHIFPLKPFHDVILPFLVLISGKESLKIFDYFQPNSQHIFKFKLKKCNSPEHTF